MTTAIITLISSCLITSVLCIQINLYSNQIVSINGWEKTGNHLLGVSAYSGLDKAKDTTTRNHLVDDLGINTIGFGQTLSQLLPTDSDEAWKVGRWKNALSTYISSGDACKTYAETYTAGLWSDSAYKAKGIESMIYLKDNCASGNEPTLSHCYSVNKNGGTPVNSDGWWTQMMVAFVTCAKQLDSDLKYFHIWNEPNAQFNLDGKDGSYYVDFYFTVAKAIKAKYPNIYLSGPVTWCPPIHYNSWEEWFTPLIDKMVESNRKDLLNFMDFHAYTTWKDGAIGNIYARWDHVLNSINALTGYYRGKTNGGWIRSLITETNVHVSNPNDADAYWKERVIENAKQMMALSFNRDKIELRHHFDLGADSENLDFWGHTDEEMQKVLKAMNDGYPVQFQFDSVKDGYPRFDNGNCIMTQSVYDKTGKTITVLLINYCNWEKWVKIVDKNSKITWNNKASFARRWGVYDQWVTISGTSASLTLKALSVTAVTGIYSSIPSWYTQEKEFMPYDESLIMKKVGYNSDSAPVITIPCWISGLDSSWVTRYAYIKFGFFNGPMFDYKWKIQVKIGSTVYFTKENFVATMEYNELKITSWSFYQKVANGATVNIVFTGTRTGYVYRWKEIPGRFVFASVVVGNGNVELSSSAFEEDEGEVSSEAVAMSAAGIILTILAILIGICVTIFVTCYCIKRRKMKGEVTFQGTQQDTPEPEAGMTDADKGGNTTSGYDMSPLNNDETGAGDDTPKEEQDQELEINVEMEENQGTETGAQYQ